MTEFLHSGLIGRGEYRTEILQLLAQKKDETRIHERPAQSAFHPRFLTMNVLK